MGKVKKTARFIATAAAASAAFITGQNWLQKKTGIKYDTMIRDVVAGCLGLGTAYLNEDGRCSCKEKEEKPEPETEE